MTVNRSKWMGSLNNPSVKTRFRVDGLPDYVSCASWYRWLLTAFLNEEKVFREVTVGGRAFQTVGAAWLKARSARVVLVDGTANRFMSAERSLHTGLYQCKKSCKYWLNDWMSANYEYVSCCHCYSRDRRSFVIKVQRNVDIQYGCFRQSHDHRHCRNYRPGLLLPQKNEPSCYRCVCDVHCTCRHIYFTRGSVV